MTAHDVDADFSGSEPENEYEIRRDPWIKRVLPRTMFGRSLLIVVIPLILLQAIATWVFYDRHWAAISWRLSAAVAGDIGLLIDALKLADSPAQAARLLERAKAQTDLDVTVRRAAALPPALPMTGRLIEDQLNQAILGRVDLPFRIDLAEEGAVEIRRAAIAFMTMRDRLQRQVRQRTQMLAGVSHDLRTPLTRMKLALEILGDDPAVAELKSDVAEMEHMVHGYLDFVRGQ